MTYYVHPLYGLVDYDMGLLRFWLSPRLLRSGERSWKDNGHADQVQRGVQA